jgi:CBS domain containing-hemolysin-like protein
VYLTLQAAAGAGSDPGVGSILARTGAALLLVALNAFFVSAEFALVNARRSRMEPLVRAGKRRARWADAAIARADHHIAGTQLGITLASLGLGWIGATILVEAVAHLLPGVTTATAWVAAAILVFVLLVLLHVVLAELVPRSVAVMAPESVAMATAGPLLLFSKLLLPVIVVVGGAANALLRVFGVAGSRDLQRVHRPEELEMLLEQTYEHGLLREEPVEMIRGVFGLSETTAAEIMTPRTSMVAIPVQTGVADAARFILEEGHSRYPVYDESLDQIVGVLLARDVWRAQVQGVTDLRQLLRPPLFVPDTKPVEALLRELRRERAHLAIVIDEFGGTEGLVTIEDVVEEIVGEIDDELDEAPAPLDFGPDGTVVMSGAFGIGELNELYDFGLPDEDYTTVGGFVLSRLGRVAVVGDTVAIRGGSLRVLEMEGRRVAKLVTLAGAGVRRRMAATMAMTRRTRMRPGAWWRSYFDDAYYALHDPLFDAARSRREVAGMIELLGTAVRRPRAGCAVRLGAPRRAARRGRLRRRRRRPVAGAAAPRPAAEARPQPMPRCPPMTPGGAEAGAADAATPPTSHPRCPPVLRRRGHPGAAVRRRRVRRGDQRLHQPGPVPGRRRGHRRAAGGAPRAAPGGRLLLESMHRDDVVAAYAERDAWTLPDGTEVRVRRRFDAVTGISHERLSWRRGEETGRKTHALRLRTATEIAGLLDAAGFTDVAGTATGMARRSRTVTRAASVDDAGRGDATGRQRRCAGSDAGVTFA